MRSNLDLRSAPAASRLGPRLAALLLLPALSAISATAAPFVANSDAPPAAAAAGQQPSGFGPLDPSAPSSGLTAEQLIQRFGERELAFAKARDQYTFRQTVRVQTISDTTGKPDGEYQEVTDIVFDDADKRTEHVVFAPQNTLTSIIMSQADFDDIAHRLPFVLTTPELPQYDINYIGKQRVDEIETYVFDVRPKELVKGKRYFKGRIWVDQEQFEIVLINGKSVPDDVRPNHADLSPPYTTYYSEVDGGNWFPVYTKADGILHFPAQYGALAQNVHIRYFVKYEDYKRFHARSRIIYNGEDLPATEKPGTAKPSAPQAAPPPAPPSGDDAPIPPPTPPSENGVKQKPVPTTPPS